MNMNLVNEYEHHTKYKQQT